MVNLFAGCQLDAYNIYIYSDSYQITHKLKATMANCAVSGQVAQNENMVNKWRRFFSFQCIIVLLSMTTQFVLKWMPYLIPMDMATQGHMYAARFHTPEASYARIWVFCNSEIRHLKLKLFNGFKLYSAHRRAALRRQHRYEMVYNLTVNICVLCWNGAHIAIYLFFYVMLIDQPWLY